MPRGFGARLRRVMTQTGPLVVGIDPHPGILEQWRMPDSASGAERFGLDVVGAARDVLGIVKPQVALFEQFGADGFAALETVMQSARAAGLIVIADAKRGDIGSTMSGYVRAWLKPGSPLEADAVTLNPYLGVGALDEALEVALAHDKGAFVLAATSNPEARALQSAPCDEGPLARTVAVAVNERDPARVTDRTDTLASIGLVIGATVSRDDLRLDDDALAARPILAPGFGAQGVDPAELSARFGAVSANVLPSESRSVVAGDRAGLRRRMAERCEQYVGRTGYRGPHHG